MFLMSRLNIRHEPFSDENVEYVSTIFFQLTCTHRKSYSIMLSFVYISFAFFLLAIAHASTVSSRDFALVMYDPTLLPLNDSSASLSPEVKQLLTFLNTHYDTTLSQYSDDEVLLFYDDFPRFDHLVLLPSLKKAIGAKSGLNQHQLLKFINEGGNIFAVGGSEASLPEGIRIFLNEVGIYPAPKGYKYIDHFNSKNGVVELKGDNLISNNRIVENLNTIEYTNGNAALISNNELIQPIIKATKTGYTNKVGQVMSDESTWTFAEQGYLAVGFQALNNARLVWVGSIDLLADDSLYKWCFQDTGVIKLQFVQHIKANEPENLNPHLYRIKDQAIYTIGVSEYKDGKWIPFQVKNEDEQLQLSFKMLDPYQRLNLSPLGPVSSTENSSELDAYAYFVNFTVPDHHGMFTFELDYKRNGLSYILDKKVVTVRHLANDEFKRSWDISNSWLYIASTVLVIFAWFSFVVSYLYIGKPNHVKKNI